MNLQYFSKEDIKNGTFTSFVKALVDFGNTSENHYNDIRIAPLDCGAVQVEWEEINFKHKNEEGEFVFVDSDHAVLKEIILPDESSRYIFDDEDENQIIKDWLKEHPTWKRSKTTGRYYDANEEKAE